MKDEFMLFDFLPWKQEEKKIIIERVQVIHMQRVANSSLTLRAKNIMLLQERRIHNVTAVEEPPPSDPKSRLNNGIMYGSEAIFPRANGSSQ